MRVLVQHAFTEEIADAAVSGRPVVSELEGMVPGLQLDPEYAPVMVPRPAPAEPGGNPLDLGQSFEFSMAPEHATYLVRGELADELAATAHSTRHPNVVGIFADVDIETAPTCGGDPAVGTADDVAAQLAADQLAQAGMDGAGVALAVVDTGINLAYLAAMGRQPQLDARHSLVPSGVATLPGAHPVHHGTMCAFDAGIAAPAAVLVDHAVLLSPHPTRPSMVGLLSDAVRSYGALLRLARSLPARYHSLVVTNSWGMFAPGSDFPVGHPGNYSDNAAHPFNVIVTSLVAAGADVLFAAGNCGRECPDSRCQFGNEPPICGANSHPSVICLAGIDVNNGRVGYSSQGPGRLFADKPDISSYTHFTGSRVFDPDPDSGTSAACPVAAGVVAAIRSRMPSHQMTPAQLKSVIFQTATDLGTAGYDYDFGWGTVDVPALLSQLARAGAA